MFKKLRNKLVLINAGITSVVVIVMFGIIYATITGSANNRPPMPKEVSVQVGVDAAASEDEDYSEEVRKIVMFTVHEEKRAAAESLLITLILSGVAIEVAVILVSYLMADQAIRPVREAYEAQKVFIANASHEIKTPLAAISANLEAADISGNKWIDNVALETEKLTRLNGELLTLARADLLDQRAAEETDLAALVRESIKSFTPRMQNLKLKEKIILSEKVKINREDFTQVLNILLDNAVKYAGTKIILELASHRLVVENDGATIAPEKLPHVFDRFYQVDKTAEGVGLGLSIAKSVAERNGWKLEAASDKKNTRFTLSF